MGNKLTRTLIISLGAMLAFAGIASAEHIESVNYNYDSKMVEISGRDFEAYNGSYATVLVVKGDGNDLTNFTDLTAEMQEEIVIEDGSFELSFKLHNPTEGTKYTAFVKAGSVDKESSFTYTANIADIFDYIMGNKAGEDGSLVDTADKFAEAISKYSSELILDYTAYGSLTDKLAAGKMAYAEKSAITNVEELKQIVLKYAYIEALNEGKLSEVVAGTAFRDAKLLGLEDLSESAYTLYTSSITDDGKSYVLEAISNKGYKNEKAFLDDFVYQTTIAAIKYNKSVGGVGHINSVIVYNNTRNGFDLTNYKKVSTSEIDRLLLANTDWSKDNVQEILDTKVDSGSSISGSSSSTSNPGVSAGGYSTNLGVVGTTEPTSTFTDLGDVEWARDAIEALAAAGVVSGRGNGIYAPLDSVTRAEFLQMLVKALGVTSENATCEFLDVEAGAWYYQAVATGTTLGLASGYGNGYFGTTDLITRQDAAVMLNNAATKSGKELISINDGIDFADKTDISDYAADDVEILVKASILSGANGNFMPKNNCSRAEAAVMISKLMTALGLEG